FVPTVSIADADNNITTAQVTVQHGTLHANLSSGATLIGGAQDSNTVTISGTQAQLTFELSNVKYYPVPDYNGHDTWTTIVTDAIGLQASGTIDITVTPDPDIVDDAMHTTEDNANAATLNVVTPRAGIDLPDGADNFEGTPVVTSFSQ